MASSVNNNLIISNVTKYYKTDKKIKEKGKKSRKI